MKYIFPENFYWGGASSGAQTEGFGGNKAQTIWEHDYQINPEKFFDRVSNLTASNFYYDYPEYIENMVKSGVKSFRTSIQWSRVVSDAKGTPNPEGLEFYHKVIDALVEAGIEPMICLFHFDTPLYMMEQGGFESKDTIESYVQFAELCFKEYGSKVHYWSTFNEPVVVAELGYLYQCHYPEVVDMGRAAQVAFNLQVASSRAIEKFHSMKMSGEIGIILNLTPSYPPQNATKKDAEACQIADLIFNRSFLDPSVKGEYPKELIALAKRDGFMVEYSETELECIQNNTVDYLGVNYYTPRRAKARTTAYDSNVVMPEKYFESYAFEGQKMNPYRGWEIYENAVYDIAINIKENYGNIKWYISENGMGVEGEERFKNASGEIEDDYRINFLKDHLAQLHKGISAGSNCFGYHLWTPFDCWSWRNAYKNRYGLIAVDIYNGCKQTIKKSGHWFKDLSDSNGFEG